MKCDETIFFDTPYLFGYKKGFPSLEWLQITKYVLWNFALICVLPFLNNSKDQDLSYKDGPRFLWIVLEGN